MGSSFQINLSTLMQERGLTYRDMASMEDVPQSTVFGWANGASPIDISAIHQLSKKLNVDFQWLLTGEKSAKDLTGLN